MIAALTAAAALLVAGAGLLFFHRRSDPVDETYCYGFWGRELPPAIPHRPPPPEATGFVECARCGILARRAHTCPEPEPEAPVVSIDAARARRLGA